MKNPILYDNGHFDCESGTDGTDQTEDFTLRDWFAGKALEGLLSNHEAVMSVTKGEKEPLLALAGAAYGYADSMLKARGVQ